MSAVFVRVSERKYFDSIIYLKVYMSIIFRMKLEDMIYTKPIFICPQP